MSLDLVGTLRERREDRGLTQAELSDRCGVADTIISRIETGRISDPRVSTLVRLAEGLEISPGDFLESSLVPSPSEESVLSVLQDCKEELRARFHVSSIGLFGSRARGDSNEGSDVDLLVNYEPGHRDVFNHTRLEEYLESKFDCAVDLVMDSPETRDSHPRIRSNIERDLIRV